MMRTAQRMPASSFLLDDSAASLSYTERFASRRALPFQQFVNILRFRFTPEHGSLSADFETIAVTHGAI